MLDADLKPFLEKTLGHVARAMATRGFTGNMVTMIGGGFAIACFACLVFGAYGVALVFMLLNRLCDGLDGLVARHGPGGVSDFGRFIDIIMDAGFYAGFLFFFALGAPSAMAAAAFLIVGIMMTTTTSLAYTLMAERQLAKTDDEAIGNKTPATNARSMTEGAETIILFVTLCLLPHLFTPLALVFGFFCIVTAVTRSLRAYRDFSNP